MAVFSPGWGARLNRMPAACIGDMFVASVKKGKPELRKKVMPAVVIRQRKQFRRKDGSMLYFEGELDRRRLRITSKAVKTVVSSPSGAMSLLCILIVYLQTTLE
jgi:hypothetical protein